MHPSLDPEIFMAKLLCKLSGTEPEALIPGGHDETGAYYPNFARSHLYDRQLGADPEVFAWRKYVLHARKMIEEMTRNGQTIYQSTPHFYHGDREEVFNFRIVFWTDFPPEDFQPAWPTQLLGSLNDGWRFEVSIQARSEKEAVGIIFDSFVGTPRHIRILSLEQKPWDWSPFTDTFKQEDGVRWTSLPPKE